MGDHDIHGAHIELAHRCVDPSEWERLLVGYYDQEELVRALRFGWDFSLLPDPDPRDAPTNLPSALEFHEGCHHLLLGGKTRDSGRLAMARLIVGEQFRGGFRVTPTRISTEQNILADALSRLGDEGKWDLFHQTVSGYGVVPSRIDLSPTVFDLSPSE